ncbi:MAG: hypothetical protein Ta2B_18460 [Termitinemataceae bacterium]|nr:MAG: hypothetical protein Ta2B_18460 [Termitinemataceae bacterium]
MEMAKLLKKKTGYLVFIGFSFTIIALITACGGNKIAQVYIEESEDSVSSSKEKQVHYFFDRTESMRGFTEKGDKSEYVRAIDSIWTKGDKAFGSSVHSNFYEFGETLTCEISLDRVQKEANKPAFYGTVDNEAILRSRGEIVKRNGGQPFRSVVEYIKELNETQNAIAVVITDLYEQNGANQFFVTLFKNAFESGLSGGMFAIESSFAGNINDISSVDSNKNIRVNGISTFFIFFVGDSKDVKEYSKELKGDFDIKELKYKESLFILDDYALNPQKMLLKAGAKNVNVEERFNSEEYKYMFVNLIPHQVNKWQESSTNKSGYESVKSEALAYRVVNNVGSRFFAGIPVEDGFDDFDCTIAKIEYFDGKENERGKASKFSAYEKPIENIIIASVGYGEEIPADVQKKLKDGINDEYAYLTFEIKNKNLSSGYYKIQYSVTPVTPSWVKEKSASSIEQLAESNRRGELIRVLNFAKIYKEITDAFKKVKLSGTYSNTIYILKNN